MTDMLCECDHCGVLRVYEAGKSCPGCGAPLTPGERRVELSEPDAEERNNNLNMLDQMRGMQQSQLDMNRMLGMQQSSHYLNQLGLQHQILQQEMSALFGLNDPWFGRERRGKK